MNTSVLCDVRYGYGHIPFIHSRAVLTVTLFVCRGMIAGMFQAAYVYTPEVSVCHCHRT